MEETTNQYKKLWEISQKLKPYYGIDKVKSWAVFVYSKANDEDVFDILEDKLIFYNGYKEENINKQALAIIKEIQEQLKIMSKET